MPPSDRDIDVRETESPRLPDQNEIIDEGVELMLAAKGQIIDEHGLDSGISENPPVTFGHHPSKSLNEEMCQRIDRPYEYPHSQSKWAA